jgi:hypothetical protein
MNSFDRILHSTSTGEKQDRYVDPVFVEALQRFKPIHIRHIDVEYNDVESI